MRAFVNHEAIREVPLVLETPTENGKGFAWNVERVTELHD
jgi:deoxyribonuclease-4